MIQWLRISELRKSGFCTFVVVLANAITNLGLDAMFHFPKTKTWCRVQTTITSIKEICEIVQIWKSHHQTDSWHDMILSFESCVLHGSQIPFAMSLLPLWYPFLNAKQSSWSCLWFRKTFMIAMLQRQTSQVSRDIESAIPIVKTVLFNVQFIIA